MSRDGVKFELFIRDGWKEFDPEAGSDRWFVICAGSCGRTLTRDTATVDRYPVPGMAGGTYHLDNTRLACAKCNVKMATHGYDGPSLSAGMSHWQRKVWNRALRRGTKPVITPQEIFGPKYEPGQGKLDVTVSRRHFETKQHRSKLVDPGSTQGSRPGRYKTDGDFTTWECGSCGAKTTGSTESALLAATRHYCYESEYDRELLRLTEDVLADMGLKRSETAYDSRHARLGHGGYPEIRDPLNYVGKHRV